MKHTLFLTLVLSMATFSAMSYDFEANGIYYDINGNEAIVTRNTSSEYSGDVVIPETVSHEGVTYTVTTIGDSAFYYCLELTGVTIPNTVTTISSHAFWNCHELTNVTIGNSVTLIDDKAFYMCTSLPYITLPDALTHIGSMAFGGCGKLEGVTIPNSVTSIDDEAFRSCRGMLSLTIGNSVTHIGDYAFDSCNKLHELTIPSSVTHIGFRAFTSTALRSIIVDSNNPVYDSRENCNSIIETSSNTLIKGCINSFIPGTITSLADYAFFNVYCNDVRIPGSVTAIGDYAFAGTYVSRVTSLAVTPPTIEKNTFTQGSMDGNAILCVPFASRNAYLFAGWSKFRYIRGLGDIDNNNELTISDLVILIDYILNGTITYRDNPAADVNGDGYISITDVTTLIQLLLSMSD